MELKLIGPTQQMPTVQAGTPVVISVVRNESLRLPYFLTYYRTLGFERFIMIDNESDDGTREFLLEQPDVTLFHCTYSFLCGRFGVEWVQTILDAHCHDRWILLSDADELLFWPNSEHESVQDLIARLDKMQVGGLFATMIDMYSDKSFGEVGYVRGEPFLAATPFFDRGSYWLADFPRFPYHRIHGGPRARTFSRLVPNLCFAPAVSKTPLIRWQKGQQFGGSAHTLQNAIELAPMRGALLHFKLFDDAPAECIEEVARGEHWSGGVEYQALGLAIEQAPNRSFFDPLYSVHYEGTSQLVALGLMHEQDPFGALPDWIDDPTNLAGPGAAAPGPGRQAGAGLTSTVGQINTR